MTNRPRLLVAKTRVGASAKPGADAQSARASLAASARRMRTEERVGRSRGSPGAPALTRAVLPTLVSASVPSPSRRTAHGLADCCRIASVILLASKKGSYKLGCNQVHFVSEGADHPRPVVCPSCGLTAHDALWGAGKEISSPGRNQVRREGSAFARRLSEIRRLGVSYGILH